MADSLRLLIVEDQDETRSVLRTVAKELGLTPITHTRGESAVDVFGEADMMVLDWHLPDTDPETVLQHWQRSKTGPVAVLYTEMPDVTHARLLSCYVIWNVFPQPPTYEALRETMRTLLRRYSESVLVPRRVAELERRMQQISLWMAGVVIALCVSVGAMVVMLIRLLE